MGTFCILRRRFLDRLLPPAELSALSEMLLQWYGLRAGQWASQGRMWCEAEVYALPDPAYPAVGQNLGARAPSARVERCPSDGIKLVGPVQNAGEPVDLSVWNAVLTEPSAANGCVMLRLTVQGPVRAMNGTRGKGRQTFVLCGTPTSGMLLLKALWPVGRHTFVQQLYQFTAWTWEEKFLGALEIYLAGSVGGQPAAAAAAAWRALGKGRRGLFSGRWDEQKVVWIARVLAEMPDDKSIASFVRRVITPLLFGAAVGIPLVLKAPPPLVAAGVAVGAISLFMSARVVWRKAASIWRYRRGMRANQAALYTKPIRYRQVDASGDTTSTLTKASAELEVLGAEHVCDFDTEVGDTVAYQGSRFYALGDARVMIGMVRKTPGSLTFFPAKPVVILSTRFADGRRHSTTNAELYERPRLAHITARRLPEDGKLTDLIELHRRHVARLLAQGAVPVPPPKTPAQAFSEMHLDDEEERRGWQQSPCSWIDALRFAFKICPREYLPD